MSDLHKSLFTPVVSELNRIFTDPHYEKELSEKIMKKEVIVTGSRRGSFDSLPAYQKRHYWSASTHYRNLYGKWELQPKGYYKYGGNWKRYIAANPDYEYELKYYYTNFKYGERSYGAIRPDYRRKYFKTLDGKEFNDSITVGVEIVGAVVKLEKNGKYAYNNADGLTVKALKIYCKWNGINTKGFKEKVDYTRALMKV
jgi:hypothetical protein